MPHQGEKIRTPKSVTILRNTWEHLPLAAMKAAWSIYDDCGRHRPDGKVADWDSDAASSDEESLDDSRRLVRRGTD
jgi:hypothetical protein